VKHRRDAEATRAAILASAADRFARVGYEHAGVREIAADAGVTAALVNRYFGSKEGLFAEVVATTFDIRPLIDGDRRTFPERLARLMVHGRDDAPGACQTTPILLLVRSMAEPTAARLLREGFERNQDLDLMARYIGGSHATIRAALLFALLTGLAFVDKLLLHDALERVDREALVALFTQCVATCVGQSAPHSRGVEGGTGSSCSQP
jgi:AcrR family transcriptional regulator